MNYNYIGGHCYVEKKIYQNKASRSEHSFLDNENSLLYNNLYTIIVSAKNANHLKILKKQGLL